MSLINEALKKAQKLRTQEQPSVQPPVPGGGPAPVPVLKRRKPLSARTVVWSLFGALSLVIFSVAFTILFLSDDETPSPEPAPRIAASPRPATPAAPAATETTPPAVITPPAPAAGTTPAITIAPESGPATPTPAPSPSLKPVDPPVLTPAPAAATETVNPPAAPLFVPLDPTPTPANPARAVDPAPAQPTPPASTPAPSRATPSPNARPNPQVYQLIDTFRITGIRASVTDPKVLMNDRLFRLNDIVDRATGLRLLKIESSSLTFVDATGAVYTKNF